MLKADAKNAASAESATLFPVGSYVLCRYTDRPPTRVHTKWHGPYCIVSFKGSEYVLANLVNHKKRSARVKVLKIFNYDPEVDVPADTALRGYMEFVVKKPTTMSFHVKRLNYDDSHNTWEPWKSLRLCEA